MTSQPSLLDPQSTTLKRFPLIARSRPPCLPLPQRLAALTALANQAADTLDQTKASAVYNQTALLASDIGLTSRAIEMCREQARIWLNRTPLSGEQAIHALEPVVNLARLDIRAGLLHEGRQSLQTLYRKVRLGESASIAGTEIPQRLVHDGPDHAQVVSWLWRVLLAEVTRTFTLHGQWELALEHLNRHQGVGSHMLDGRQVAIINALTSGHAFAARSLLNKTAPGPAWEQHITACLNVLHESHFGSKVAAAQTLEVLLDELCEQPENPGIVVFNVRLNLTVLDLLLEHPELSTSQERLWHATTHRVQVSENGYAAKDLLASSRARTIPPGGLHALEHMVRNCGLSGITTSPEDQDRLGRIIQVARPVLTAARNQRTMSA